MSTDDFHPNADELVAHNREFAELFHDARLEVAPTRHLAVVACMDSRMDMFQILGLADGEAHILRNAGGVVTDDVIRSLCLSQRLLGTREIVLVHHNDCGLEKVQEVEFLEQLEAETGRRAPWTLQGFADPAEDVRTSIGLLQGSPFLLHKDHIRGFVYDVHDGLLQEVR